ncbi:MAG: stage II sporulation protein R [Lachnospiraceae bacterium]|nr:stage II sporulation protein R [Lachnospira sp.]MBR6697115.1 stage II sporulation protein R [Lachnospiraceae bacterium]
MKKIITVLLLVLIVGIFLNGTYKSKEKLELQKSIADSLIRFHVRANSDSNEDQELKLKVKERVLELLQEELKTSDSIDASRNILEENIEEIKELALEVIHSEGYDYEVSVYFENAYFPMKTYGDICLPPGEYEAFRIDIGKVEGKNWWCVIYPPLCFVDSTCAVVPDDTKAKFKEVLSEDAYEAITISNKDEIEYEIEFKYLKFLN